MPKKKRGKIIGVKPYPGAVFETEQIRVGHWKATVSVPRRFTVTGASELDVIQKTHKTLNSNV